MPRTKHLVLLFVGIIVILLLFLIVFLLTEDQEAPFTEAQEATIILASTEMGVEIADGSEKESTRATLITKLRGRMPESEDVEAVTESVPSESDDAVHEVDTATNLPIHEGSITSRPQAGYVFACDGTVGDPRQGLPWIEDGAWFPERKVSVGGSVMHENMVTLALAEGARIITANGLPKHPTGIFPIDVFDKAYDFSQNEHAIRPQAYSFQLPQNPLIGQSPLCVPRGVVGVTLEGVAIYSALDETGRDAVAYGVFDSCGGHSSESGVYHYHGVSECLTSSVDEGAPSTLVGYALDGFGLFSDTENGEKVTNADLDVCHGHIHSIPWDGQMVSLYHYHMTSEFPYSVGCFAGAPVLP